MFFCSDWILEKVVLKLVVCIIYLVGVVFLDFFYGCFE